MSVFKATVVGNVGKDPESSFTTAGKLWLKFSVATSRKPRDGDEITTWVKISLYDRDAEFWNGKIFKGDKVLAIGNLEFSTYAKKDGGLGFNHEISPWGITVENLSPKQAPASGADDDELPF